MHDVYIIGIPSLLILFGILLNRSDFSQLDLKNDKVRDELSKKIESVRDELNKKIASLRDDLRQFVCTIGPYDARLDTIESKGTK